MWIWLWMCRQSLPKSRKKLLEQLDKSFEDEENKKIKSTKNNCIGKKPSVYTNRKQEAFFMIQAFRINTIRGREILDSRGNPTIEVEVKLCGGARAEHLFLPERLRGAFEAVELRDSELPRYRGNGVKRAVENVNDILADKLEGKKCIKSGGN